MGRHVGLGAQQSDFFHAPGHKAQGARQRGGMVGKHTRGFQHGCHAGSRVDRALRDVMPVIMGAEQDDLIWVLVAG